jgi:hypothetical protein
MDNELERYGRKRIWPNIKYYHGICLGVLKKTTKGLSHCSRSPSRDLNPEPSECEVGVLTIQPRRSMGAFYVLYLGLDVGFNYF